MDRRTFLGTVAGGLLTAPLAAEAQEAGKVPRVGILLLADSAQESVGGAFREGLRETVRTPVVGSRRRCPVCQQADLTGRQTVCSASCRGERSRQRETAARQTQDREIRILLETALRKLQEGGP